MEKHSEATVRAVKKFLGGMGIGYEYTREDGFCFSIGFDGCKIDPIYIQILPLAEAYILYATSPVPAGNGGIYLPCQLRPAGQWEL